MYRLFLLFLLCWSLIPLGYGQDSPTVPGQENQSPKKPASAISGIRYQSLNRLDPFIDPILLAKHLEEQAKAGEEVLKPKIKPPGIAGMFIEQIKLIGISGSANQQTAVFRGSDDRAYFLHNGDKVLDGYVEVISSEEVHMIRETKLRSGKVLTQKITKRLRTP
jgi:Tfp pilus assembly protein PilP